MSSPAATDAAVGSKKLIAVFATVFVVTGSVIGGVCGSGLCQSRTATAPTTTSSLSTDATALTATIPTDDPTAPPAVVPPLLVRIIEGALVTNDCLFQSDYGYAIDIFWSCGDERFNEPLRLHTFKRHSLSHQLVFADQLITYDSSEQLLWFEQYNDPRCVQIAAGGTNEWRVTTETSQCTRVRFVEQNITANKSSFWIQDVETELCAATTFCDDDESTGGSECGGIDHRFLPLRMDKCQQGAALTFSFATVADLCPNERPGNSCF